MGEVVSIRESALPVLGCEATLVPAESGGETFALPALCEERIPSAEFGGDGFAWFGEMLRRLKWTKPAYTLHYFTGAPESTCEKHVRGVAVPSATVLRDVLRSTEGGNVLAYIMRGSDAPWWQQHLLDRMDGAILRESIAKREEQLRLPIE